MFMSCLRVLLIKYYIYQSQIKSLYILELMFYRVVSNALRITTNSNPFTSCSLLIEGFKAFHFFKLTLHFKLNQALNWSTGFVLFNFSDKVCSSHQGVLYLINNSKSIFQALSRSYNDLEWRENQSRTWQEEYFNFTNTWHYHTWMATQALSSVFWQALPLLSQSLKQYFEK